MEKKKVKDNSEAPFPYKDKRIPSIWDSDVDIDKLASLTPLERAKYFPNDYNSAGEPYGDF